jgi:hypothetical protein
VALKGDHNLSESKPCGNPSSESQWLSDYGKGWEAAQKQNKMLLLFFCDSAADGLGKRFQAETLKDPRVVKKLRDYVCVQLPLDLKIPVEGHEIALIGHGAFRDMGGRPGVAIIDFRHDDPKFRGSVVSAFPLNEKLWYTPEHFSVILDLPPGTLTQRTLIFAVRTHPDKPASAEGEALPALLEEAQDHSQYQANIRQLGHQFWESRFLRVIGKVPGGANPHEVCAESWPGDNLVEAAVECVRCWRLSPGHWSAVRSSHRFFGYDMKRGDDGVWYATGILSGT